MAMMHSQQAATLSQEPPCIGPRGKGEVGCLFHIHGLSSDFSLFNLLDGVCQRMDADLF
jgi:hypothetical protein